MIRAVIYARFSCDNQRDESIEGQLRECKAFAKEKEAEIIDEYIDKAVSAKTDNRPSFQKMIADSYKHLFDVIIVWKLDRFARNRGDSAKYKSILRKNGVRVVSATEAISQGAEGIILESVLEGMAEYYSADLAQKVSRGMTDNVLEGKWNGSKMPLGYKLGEDQKLVIDEGEAPLVRRIFELYTTTNLTANAIALKLRQEGALSSTGTPLPHSTVGWILRNRKYLGEYRFNETINKHAWPAIIDEATFNRAQEKLDANKHRSARFKADDDYILTGKLYCGKCGCFMTAESSNKAKDRIYRYYKCQNVKRHHTCDKAPIRKEVIETLVINTTQVFLRQNSEMDDLVEKVFDYQQKGNPEIPNLENQIAALDKKSQNLVKAIEDGMTFEGIKERYRDIEDEKAKIQQKLDAERLQSAYLTKDQIKWALAKFSTLDTNNVANRRFLIDSFINAIYLYDDGHMDICFNYRGATKKVTIKEISSTPRRYGSPFVDNPNLFLVEEGFGFSFDLKQPKLLPWRTKEPIIVGKGQSWRPTDAIFEAYPSKNLRRNKKPK